MKKVKVTPQDLLKMKFVNWVVMSPDESRVMFTSSVASEDKRKYHSHIYMVNVDGSDLRQYTFGKVTDSAPVFSPDGRWIIFTSKRGHKKGVYRMPTEGGEPELLIGDEGSYSEISISPNGKKILYVFAKDDDVPKDKNGKKEPPVYRHITRLFYKLDSRGFLPKDRGHVYVFDIESGKSTQIGRMKNGERSPVWFPDSRRIAFIANVQRDPDRDALRDDIFVTSEKGGKPRKLSKPEGEAEMLSMSPDGKWIAYIGQDDPDDAWGVTNLHVWRVPTGAGSAVDLTPKLDRMAFDLTISDTSESHSLMAPIWSADGRKLYFQVTDAGATHLCSASASGGNVRKVIRGKLRVTRASLAGKCKQVAAIITTPTMPAEVHISGVGPNSKPKRITSLNADLVKSLDLRKPEEVIVRGNDNNAIHGWILKPPRFSAKRKYPSIMQIHGGPRVQYGYSFFHEMQYLAAQGYVVYYCNPRGGQGYGRKHAECIVSDWGTVDYEDCMSMADHMEIQKYIDVKKMGVTGGSYGGYMTNWIVSHTNRFRAAVTQRSVTNFISMYGSSDIGFDLGRELKGSPYADHDKWWELSPIKHVRKIRTPLLIIHSEQDLRCPIEQGEQLFIALKMLRRTVEMVRFPGEPHGLSRGGRPDRRIARLEWMLKWFDRHLKGKK